MRPIFETPRLDDVTPASGVERGFFGSVTAGFEAQRAFDNFQSREMALSRAYRDYLDEVEALTGERLRTGEAGPAGVDMTGLNLSHSRRGVADDALADLERQVADLQARRPDVDIPPVASVMERLRAEAADIEAAEGQAGAIGGFIGRIGGAFTDPITLATAPLGGAQKTIARAIGVEAGVNALLEAANIPVANQWRAELGVDTMGLREAAASVAVAGVAGGVLGGGVKAAEIGLPRAVNSLSNSRLARMVRELSGDNPERRAIADALEREAEIEAANPFPPVDADLHEARLQDAVTVLSERGTERAASAAARLAEDAPAPAARGEREDPLAGQLPAGLQSIDPRELEVDAARFQFKAGGDAEGVTDRLAGVTEWDPVRAGIAIVYEQADGRRFIADGHQRRGLAARLLDEDPSRDIALTAYVYREADGWTDAEIRALAAAKNLAEGTGTAIDAAKILRADPDLLDGSLPTRGALIRDAQGLMRLGDPAFGAVVNEVIPANYGAIVGRIIADPDEQLAVIDQLVRAEVRSAVEAEALVRGAQAAGFARREGDTGSLFGEVPTESLVADRARVLAKAVSILRKERTVFSTLAREADRIESAGNRLARDTNEQRARTDGQTLEILQTLAHRAGPVADALNARTRQSDGNPARAARAFVGDLRDLTASGDLGRLLAGGSGRDAGPAAPGGRAEGAPGLDLEPGRFDGGADDPAMSGQADNLAPAGEAAAPVRPEPNQEAAPGAPVRLFEFERAQRPALERRFVGDQGGRSTIEAMLEGAEDLRAELGDVLARLEGVETQLGPVKTVTRMAEKMAAKGYESAARFTDTVRGVVLARTPAEAEAAADAIAAAVPALDEGVKVHPGGYVDRKILVRLSDGRIGEIQITSPQMWAAKHDGGGDAAFNAWRVLDPGDAKAERLKADMQAIYAEALAQSDPAWSTLAGSGGRSGNMASNSAREITSPPSAQTPGLRGSQDPDASLNTNPTDGETSTAGVRSQSMNVMGDTSTANISARSGVDNPEIDDLADEFDAALIFDPGEGPRRERVTAADVEAEIAADDAAVERLRGCVP